MIVQIDRLMNQLEGQGFHLAWFSQVSREFCLVKKSSIFGLFEQILVSSRAGHGEALVAHAGISVVQGRTGTKGLTELELIGELASDPSRGWAIVRTVEEAIQWENALCKVAPDKTAALAQEQGPELLRRTNRTISVASDYLAALKTYGPLESIEQSLANIATSEQRDEAIRIAGWPGVQRIEQSAPYRVASLALVILGESVENRRYVGHDPLEDQGLMWRIQTLVDLLMPGPLPNWELPGDPS